MIVSRNDTKCILSPVMVKRHATRLGAAYLTVVKKWKLQWQWPDGLTIDSCAHVYAVCKSPRHYFQVSKSYAVSHPSLTLGVCATVPNQTNMVPFFLFVTVADALLFASPADGPCCKECKHPEKKFFSVDHGFGHEPFCGETCIDPAKYKGWLLVSAQTVSVAVQSCTNQWNQRYSSIQSKYC